MLNFSMVQSMNNAVAVIAIAVIFITIKSNGGVYLL